jgi:hypothetical protein
MQYTDDITEEHALMLLKQWKFKKYPINESDGTWLSKLCKYIYEGVTDTAYRVLSNGDGYFKLIMINEKVLLFDEIMEYRKLNNLKDINGNTDDLETDEYYDNQCRVLIKEWDDVVEIIPGLQQSRNKTWGKKFKDERFCGNTCLLKLTTENKYRYIRGGYVYDFFIDEPIEAYYSFIENNTVPEPVVVTPTKIYMLDECYIFDRSKIDTDLDIRNDFSRAFYKNHYSHETYKPTIILSNNIKIKCKKI